MNKIINETHKRDLIIRYILKYSNVDKIWRVYKEVESPYGIGSKRIYEGTKKECEKFLNKL